MLKSKIQKFCSDFFNRKKMSSGEEGERRAENFLKKKGFRILQRNYFCKTGELDLVAEDGNSLVFVEVKTRKKFGKELPEAAMTTKKKHRVCSAARHFMKNYKLTERIFRFDVVGLEFDDENNWEINYWQNAIDYNRALARKF